MVGQVPRGRKQGLPVLLKAMTTVGTASLMLCSVGEGTFHGVKEQALALDWGISTCTQ